MRQIYELVVHCSATPEGRDYTVDDITRWHKARGFDTIGYHYVVYRNGEVHVGRPEYVQGAHARDTIVTALEFVILVDVPRMARLQRTRARPNRKKL